MNKKISFSLSALVIIMLASFVFLNYDEIISGGISGEVTSTRLVIISEANVSCNTTFVQGWNLVSFPCISDDLEVSLVMDCLYVMENVTVEVNGTNGTNYTTELQPVTVTYDSVKWYDPSTPDDPWRSYNPDLPTWAIQDLSMISRRYGYWIYVDENASFYLENPLASPTLTSLDPGWNLLGYPNQTMTPINYTYGELIPNFDYVYMYNASEADWKQWTWNTGWPSDQDLNYSYPYYGYWIYMFTNDLITII
ncbi:hypothetical protein JXC34_00420 [Candidatus Woesearchaeota archaeon]|nr:hypothetical protein [Candidatus Woesearchaeota archaeon]